MTEIEKEKSIVEYPLPVTIEGTIKILDQIQNCICKIENKNGNGTGFFCYIPFKNKKLTVLLTNNHIINEKFINENERIEVSINDYKEYKIIELKNKKIYTSEKYDTTIIEINSEKEKINNYLELDEEIFEHYNINNKSVYILQYPNTILGQKAAISYGIIKNIQDEYNIIHYCCTSNGSSGSPILNLLNHKVIGIHKESVKNKNYNRGSLLKFSINEFLEYYNKKKNNEINLTIKVEENDIYQDIYFLNKDGIYNNDMIYKEMIEYYNKLLKESKIEIFINNEKYENQKYSLPQEKGLYYIKLIFKLNITNMSYMFCGCSNIINIDLSTFDTKNVTNMTYMFSSCYKLANLDLSSFDTKKVHDMSYMFYFCSNLENINLSNFDTKIIIDMSNMFSGCSNLASIDLSLFDTKNVTNMSGMFSKCSKLTNIDLSSFDTQKVSDMKEMFYKCSNLKNLNLSSFDTKNVNDMYNMFYKCSNLININLSSFDTKNVTCKTAMFSECSNLTKIDLSSFDTKNVTNMSHMFNNCSNLSNIELSSFDTSNVENMNHLFYNCSNFTDLDLTSFDTKNVTDMSDMFSGCSNLTKLNLSSFDTKNVTDMSGMFYNCYKLLSIDLSSFDTCNVTNMNNMFSQCFKLEKVKINNIIQNQKLKNELK